ncbi:S8 family serine peptidase [Heyndrickxia sp. NPDC080065]|uniref:peptidase S8 n=1 Tax=Heyndrickxia sp. NPDC080065 TaxID=3390568 RepID=UPI003D06F9C7
MKIKKLSSITAVVLIFALIFGFIIPQKFLADTYPVTSIDEATTIATGQSIEGSFETPDVRWYKISPTNNDITNFSHMKLEVKSNQMINVSVYSSKENAKQDKTFEQYIAGTNMEPQSPDATINFPYAWDGPYYIKVEYFGDVDYEEYPPGIDLPPGTELPSEGGELSKATFTLSASSVKLPPSTDFSSDMNCPVEFSASGQKSGTEMLKTIRLFRDGILSKTDEGRKLTSLYYKSAPFLVLKLALSKSTREDVYKNLQVLQPLITDLNKKGEGSSRVISKEEQKAINTLFDISIDAVPSKLKAEMESLADKAELSSLAGEQVTNIAKKVGIALPSSFVPGDKYIIKLKPGKKLSAVQSKAKGNRILSSLSSIKTEDPLFDDMYVLHINNDGFAGMSAQAKTYSMQAAVAQIEKLSEVEFIEPVQTFKSLSNDIQSPYQWSLKNKGGDDGKKGADIQNDKLQALVKKRNLKDTLIAVVDSGVDNTLTDLKDSVRMDIGKNFVDKSASPMDDNGHGTHVSGIIAAAADNGYSMEGINQHAKIMPVKVLDASGSGDTEQIAYGIKYAVDHGAKVINLSLGGKYSRVLEYVLQYAASKNVVVVAATGNDGQLGISYPGSSKYVISVGATNTLDIVSDYSNYGKEIDLVAPGTNIPSLVPDGNVTYMSGTSMATPHVAAVAGLLLSKNPKLKVSDIRNILHQTADNVAFKEKDNKGDFGGGGSIIDLIGDGGSDGIYFEDVIKLPIGSDLVSGYGRLNGFSAFSMVDLNVKLNAVQDNQNKVTGTTVKGAKVEVRKGTKVIGKATAASNGAFSVKIPVQKSNQLLHVTVSDSTGTAKTAIKAYVKKGKAPTSPKVNSISNKTIYVTGKAQPDVKITIQNASKKAIGQGTTDSKGKFKIKIKKQKAGTTLHIKSVDLAKRESKAVAIKVKDKIPPAAPKVNPVTSKSTTVTGKAEIGSTVSLKYNGKVIGTAKSDKKGNFTIKITKKKAGSALYLTAKDKAGNVSKAVKITVKK